MPRVYTRLPIEDRFWARVEKGDGCWLWKGCKQRSGYGRIASGDPSKPIVEGAHRIAYELQCGPIPHGLYVLHHCDVPACCRGSHLFLGTAKDNNADMHAKGRFVPPTVSKGEGAPNAILSEAHVRRILASKETHDKLGASLGVAPSTIKAVRDGITWKHIGPPRKPFGGRRIGEYHGRAKLTETDVVSIRASHEPTAALARRYGVDFATLAAARTGKTWRHIP